MGKNPYINMFLKLMLKRMKERRGFVTQVSAEGHFSKKLLSSSSEDLVKNIGTAEHLLRLQFMWAHDSWMTGYNSFIKGWEEMGKFIEKTMREHGQEFCDFYKKKSN